MTTTELQQENERLRNQLAEAQSDKLAFQSLYRDAMDALAAIRKIAAKGVAITDTRDTFA